MQAKTLLMKLNYFKDTDAAFLNALALCLNQNVYSPGDEIVPKGKINYSLYLFTRGEAEMVNEKSIAMKIFSVDKDFYYGEMDIFDPHSQESAILARSFCEVYILTSDAFEKVKLAYLSNEKYFKMYDLYEKMKRQQNKLAKRLGASQITGDESFNGWKRILLPFSKFRLYWNSTMLFVVIWSLLFIPIRVAYFFFNPFNYFFVVISIFDYLGDILFIIDTILRYHFFTFEQYGITMSNSNDIHSKYLKDKIGLALDIFCIFPIDFIPYAFDARFVSFFRLLKLCKIYRIEIYFNSFAEYLETKKFTLNHNIKKIIIMLSVLLVVSHYMACFYHFLGYYIKYIDDSTENWIDVDNNHPLYVLDHSHWNYAAGYIRALYMVLLSITTVGYGDVVPISMKETLYTLFIVLIGGILYPAVIGATASSLQKIDGIRKGFLVKISNIRRYMELRNLPESLKHKIIQYYDYIWSRQHGVDELSILSDLPSVMRADATKELIGETLRNLPFFESLDSDLLKAFYSCIIPTTFLPEEYFIFSHETGNGLYIIKYGKASVGSPLHKISESGKAYHASVSARTMSFRSEFSEYENQTDSAQGTPRNSKDLDEEEQIVYAILYQGSYCGESSLINYISPVDIKTITFCDCYLLTKESFNSVLRDYPEYEAAVLKKVEEEFTKRKKMYQKIDTNRNNNTTSHIFTRVTTILNQELKTNSFFHPDSIKKKYWVLLLLAISIYNIFVVPLRVIVLTKISFELYVIDYIFDAVLIVNFVLDLFYFSYMKEGQIVFSSPEIYSNRRNHYTFYTDLLVIVPWEIAIFMAYNYFEPSSIWSFYLPLFRLPKLLICLHYDDYSNNFTRLVEEYPIIPVYFGTIFRLLLKVIIVSHFFACGFLFLGTYSFEFNYPVDECSKLYEL